MEKWVIEFNNLEDIILQIKDRLRSMKTDRGRIVLLVTHYPVDFESKLKQYIDENFCQIRSVKDLSETFNCSLAKIYKEFKKHYHITPGRYLRNLKREYALMLRKEGKPWKCIAYAIGYKSARWLYGKNLQPSKGG